MLLLYSIYLTQLSPNRPSPVGKVFFCRSTVVFATSRYMVAYMYRLYNLSIGITELQGFFSEGKLIIEY